MALVTVSPNYTLTIGADVASEPAEQGPRRRGGPSKHRGQKLPGSEQTREAKRAARKAQHVARMRGRR